MKPRAETWGDPPVKPPQWLDVVRQAVETVRFGKVEIVIHEGRVTQVDATRRTRLDPEPPAPQRS